ncbi:MAG: hypothetical protein JF625_20355 [Inquilinus limosus]|uniref:Uncharacterized protein n=1 Tax=Inquilinus limosus TaxID=171674 RepID=A0A952FSK2_9PROT|nr:hypothetical protein [Inquilinus limosus]
MTPNTRAEDPKRSGDAAARELARKDRRIRELEEELARLRASALLAQ